MSQTIIKLLNGNSYVAEVKINRNRRVNGERDISFTVFHSKINNDFIDQLETGCQLNFQGDWYWLFNEKEDKHGNKSFDGVLHFFHHMNSFWHMDETENKSMTIQDSIVPLFTDNEYKLNIIDNFYSNTMSLSKKQNSTERFLYFIVRHSAEFNIPIGTKTINVRNKIGVRRNDILIHEDDNLVELSIDTDTGSFCTAIKVYYDFKKEDEESDAVPTKEYTYVSSMAEKYGLIYGEPIDDERITTEEGAKVAAKEKQEGTFKVSFSIKADLFDIKLNEGDEIRLVVPSKALNMYVRVVEIQESFDEDGFLIGAEYTFGNDNIAESYKSMQYDAVMDIQDILMGKKPIPYSVLPKAVREATNVINDGENSLFYYRKNEVYGINQDNPLGVTRYNANGIGFSQDGGQTWSNALTYLGITASAITAGTIDTNNVTIYGDKGTNRIEITGDHIKVWDSTDPEVYTLISKGRIHSNKGSFTLTGYDGRELFNDGRMRNQLMANIQIFSKTFDGTDVYTSSTEYSPVYVIRDVYRANQLELSGTARLEGATDTDVNYLDIAVTKFGLDNPEPYHYMRKKVVKTSDPAVYAFNMVIDMKSIFNKVVDYERFDWYVKIKLVNDTGMTAAFRLNRGEWND